jgi:hypothetical protein
MRNTVTEWWYYKPSCLVALKESEINAVTTYRLVNI